MFGVVFVSETESFHNYKKRTKNNLIEVWRKQFSIWVAFFSSKSEFSLVSNLATCVNYLDLHECKPTYTSSKDKGSVKDVLHASLCSKNGRIKKETKLNPQFSFWQVLNKSAFVHVSPLICITSVLHAEDAVTTRKLILAPLNSCVVYWGVF